MKKLIALTLTLLMALSLCSCVNPNLKRGDLNADLKLKEKMSSTLKTPEANEMRERLIQDYDSLNK